MKRSAWQRNINEIVTGINRGTIVFDNPLQRPGGQWKPVNKSLLIDSALRLFIPDVYAIKHQREINGKMVNVYDVLDGLQRLTTIHDYRNDKFALTDDLPPVYIESTGEMHEIAGKLYSELDEEVQNALNGSLTIRVIELEEDDDEETVISQIFYRLNSSVPMSKEHLALVSASSKVQQYVHDTVTNNTLYTITAHFPDGSVKKSERQISVLQSLVLVGGYEWEAFGNKDVEKAVSENEITDNVIDKVTQALNMINQAFPEYNKFVTKINLVSFVNLIVNNEFNPNVIPFLQEYSKIWNKSDAYRKHCGAGGTKKSAIEGRTKGLQELYDKYISSL